MRGRLTDSRVASHHALTAAAELPLLLVPELDACRHLLKSAGQNIALCD